MNTESVMSITALCPAAVRGGYAVHPSLLPCEQEVQCRWRGAVTGDHAAGLRAPRGGRCSFSVPPHQPARPALWALAHHAELESAVAGAVLESAARDSSRALARVDVQ